MQIKQETNICDRACPLARQIWHPFFFLFLAGRVISCPSFLGIPFTRDFYFLKKINKTSRNDFWLEIKVEMQSKRIIANLTFFFFFCFCCRGPSL